MDGMTFARGLGLAKAAEAATLAVAGGAGGRVSLATEAGPRSSRIA
jgi:hypothetical protein